jgi:hypothetical protein
MGMAKLQIWFTAEGNPCTISERDDHDNLPWEVAIMHCSGQVLSWCGRRYVGLIARCGHLEVEVPPGCYVIRGGESMGVNPHGGITGNHLTDHAVVTACCDESTCVTLFAPSLHSCLFGFNAALAGAIAHDRLDDAAGRPVLEAMKVLFDKLPKSEFDDAAIPVMQELIRSVDNPKDNPKKK